MDSTHVGAGRCSDRRLVLRGGPVLRRDQPRAGQLEVLDRGQLLLAPFPYSDLRGLKRRPVCVVSSSAYSQGPDVIVAMVTSNQTRVAKPGFGDVALQDWQQAGLHQPSVVRCGRLLVIEHRLLTTGLGQLSQRDLAAVDAGLKAALGLPDLA